MILQKFPSGPLGTNTLLIACPSTLRAAVVDPAFQSTSHVLEHAARLNLAIEKILLTHSHWDHIADLHTLVSKVSVPVYVHELDASNVENPGSDRLPMMMEIRGVKPVCRICEGDFLELGSLLCRVIHTPGHTPGGVCYYFSSEHLLISGDTLFEGTIGSLSLPTSQPEEMWTSLAKLAQLPPETRVVPGHGKDTTIGREAWLSRAKELFS